MTGRRGKFVLALLGLVLTLAYAPGCRERPEVTLTEPGPGSAAPAAQVPGRAEPAATLDPAPPAPTAPPPEPPAPPKQAGPPPKPTFSRKAAIYDPEGPAYDLLQSAAQALGKFPADALGNIDWAAALRSGLIAPRSSVRGSGPMTIRDDDIIMRDTRDMPWVRFPHRTHTEWLACSNCHPRLFKEKTGATDITMETIMRGEHCGQCHDRVAFSIFVCERCHSIVHEGSPKAWW